MMPLKSMYNPNSIVLNCSNKDCPICFPTEDDFENEKSKMNKGITNTTPTKNGKFLRVKNKVLRKHVSLYVDLTDWNLINKESVRLKKPLTEICSRMLEKDLAKLRKKYKE